MQSNKPYIPLSANVICLALTSFSCSSTSDKPLREEHSLVFPGFEGQPPKYSRASFLSIEVLPAIYPVNSVRVFSFFLNVKLYIKTLITVTDQM